MELLEGSMRLTGGNKCVFCLVLLKQVKCILPFCMGGARKVLGQQNMPVVFARSLGDCFIN